jgi:hypothetical protein
VFVASLGLRKSVSLLLRARETEGGGLSCSLFINLSRNIILDMENGQGIDICWVAIVLYVSVDVLKTTYR